MKLPPHSRRALELLQAVDWPRALQRVGTFMRALRGDPEDEQHEDTAAERRRAQRIRDLGETVRRHTTTL
jgi:hypothetical protein